MLDWNNPGIAIDVIAHRPGNPREIVVIERKYAPLGHALPGGGMDYGEFGLQGGLRELDEEVSLGSAVGWASLLRREVPEPVLLGAYTNPARDPRKHVVSLVYVVEAAGEPDAKSDAKEAFWMSLDDPNRPRLMFDHEQIIADYLHFLETGERAPATR